MIKPRASHRRDDRDAIPVVEILKNNLLDADLAVDDARCKVDTAVDALRWAVARRDDLAWRLATLIQQVNA